MSEYLCSNVVHASGRVTDWTESMSMLIEAVVQAHRGQLFSLLRHVTCYPSQYLHLHMFIIFTIQPLHYVTAKSKQEAKQRLPRNHLHCFVNLALGGKNIQSQV